MKKYLIYILVLVVLCVGVFLFTKEYYSKNVKTVDRIVEKEVEKEVEKIVEKEIVITGETIKSGLNNIGKLATAEYYFTHVSSFESSKLINEFKIPGTTSKFVYSYDGKIIAGIDFTKIEVIKDDEAKKIEITLPAVETISSDIDTDSFQLYDEKNNIFNRISVTDVTDSFNSMVKDEEEKAIKNGLYDSAEENAKTLVENFMKGSYNVEDYEIKVMFE